MSGPDRTSTTIQQACLGKHRHATMADALNELSGSQKRNGVRKGMRISPYRCPFCDGFHVGHEANPKLRAVPSA